MKKTALLVTLIAGFGATQAQAGDFYLFAEGGYSDMASNAAKQDIQALDQTGEASTNNLNDTLAVTPGNTADLNYSSSDDFDDGGATFGLGAGYNVNQHLALEVSYRDIGEASYENRYEVTGTDASGTGYRENTYDSNAIVLRGVANIPVTDKISIEGLLGVAYVSTNYETGGVDNGEGLLNDLDYQESFDDSGFTATYGIGASYAVTDQLTGYARLERIHDIDTADHFDGIEADSVVAGLRYHF